MLVEIGLILIGLILLVKFKSSSRKSTGDFKNFDEIPNPGGLPLLGNISDLFCDESNLWKISRERALKYFPIYRLKILNWNVVSILDPEDIEMILSDGKLTTKGVLYETLKSWTGNGLAVSEGEIWQKRRKTLTKSFHPSILRNYIKIFQKEADSLVDNLQKIKEAVSIESVLQNPLLKIIYESIVGGNKKMSETEANKYVHAVNTLTKIIGDKCFKPYKIWMYKYTSLKKVQDDALQVVHNLSSKVCQEYQKTDDADCTMMNLMFSSPEIFGTKNIEDEIDTFIFAGHDTTKAALSFAMVTLANYPEYQNEIHHELLQVAGNDDVLSHDILQSMPFLDRFVKECLRFFTIVTLISRELRQDIITKTGYKIPAGTTLIFHIFDIHRSPKLYSEPDKFDPDRFLPENSSTRHQFSYLPFGAGPRVCIGNKFALLEIKTLICKIVRKFKLEPVEPLEKLEFITDLVLNTKNDLRVKFVERIN